MTRFNTSVAAAPIRRGSVSSAVRLMEVLNHAPADAVMRKRRLLAGLCRIVGEQLGEGYGDASAAAQPERRALAPRAVSLSPRVRQTLERLLAGDSEKEIAFRLGVSPHTVHVYVKTLYRRFDVCSRGELLARFVMPR